MLFRTVIAVCLILAAIAPGCTTTTPGSTAKADVHVADGAAHAWASDAQLLRVYSVEAANLTDFRDERQAKMDESERAAFADELAIMGANDANPGDGIAPRWLYVYSSEGNVAEYFVVVESGRVVATVESSTTDTLAPLTADSWLLDSDDAAQIAAKSNASYASIQGRKDVVVYSNLAELGDFYPHPVWFLGYELHGVGQDGAVMVDAQNGTVLDDAFIARYLLAGLSHLLPAEMGGDAGLATVAEPSHFGSFSLAAYHSHLAIAITSRSGTVPLQELQVVLTAPDGGSTWLNHTVAPGFDGVTSAVAVPAPEGTYAYTIELLDGTLPGAAANWEFSWCTEGLVAPEGPFGGGPLACEFRNA